jgi:hypothetical protein
VLETTVVEAGCFGPQSWIQKKCFWDMPLRLFVCKRARHLSFCHWAMTRQFECFRLRRKALLCFASWKPAFRSQALFAFRSSRIGWLWQALKDSMSFGMNQITRIETEEK